MPAILIFVREKRTFKFLTKNGTWAVQFMEARNFKNTWEAVDSCMKQRVQGAEIVMRFGHPLYDVVIDVG